ncbi:hypothetical protein CONPUDRAFT_150871 [Coniophora puteana RWD-64-598 SS2]|uniref:Uncharacterized protein n=1 Tax=Coniophora puteana (strain RWD-64-598) TaxID=741705 RepID=A0A5M3MYU1_CONPW|nr:uncharacterized protein CONPUDRAFT_150871 [Coniophora puteana RWD-64-598 SS2]EIW83815.1 hypothetical protein CONPUDRAFT_150871 [Coniophora puteana RWD-64-598 SS2]
MPLRNTHHIELSTYNRDQTFDPDSLDDQPLPTQSLSNKAQLQPNYRDNGKWFDAPTNDESRTEHRRLLSNGFGSLQKSSWFGLSTKTMHRLSHFLHVFLALLHFVLLGIFARHLEHRTILPITDSNDMLTTVLSASLQAFYTIYTAILVTITQRLGVLRSLERKQKLTALHDSSNAWTGIGSSLLGLWHQARLPASAAGTTFAICITLYLGCVMVLHVASSTVMQLQTFNNTIVGPVATSVAWPNASVDLLQGGGMDWTNVDYSWAAVRTMSFNMDGLAGSTVYDTVPDDAGVGSATVDATTVGFRCGLIPNSNLSTTANGIKYLIDPDLSNVPFQASALYPDQVHFLDTISGMVSSCQDGCVNVSSAPPVWPGVYNVFMISSKLASLADDSAFVNHMNWMYQERVGSPANASIATYFVGCSMYLNSSKADISAHDNNLQSTPPTSYTNQWQDIATLPSANISSGWVFNALRNSPSSTLTTQQLNFGSQNSDETSYTLSLLDLNLMKQLGVTAQSTTGQEKPPDPSFELSPRQLESALSNLAAGLMWTAGQVNEGGFQRAVGETLVTQQVLMWRLNINLAPLLFALFASLIMLGVEIFITGFSTPTSAVDSTGILEILWLSDRLPPLREGVRNVSEPTTDNLRAAGMVDVCIADEIRKEESELRRRV